MSIKISSRSSNAAFMHTIASGRLTRDPAVHPEVGSTTTQPTLIRDLGEEYGAFCSLPPSSTTTPLLERNDDPDPTSLRVYHNSKSRCIAAGQVRLADGWSAPVDSIHAGDWVATSNGGSARVECVVVRRCENRREALVELEGGVLVTPWHPVRVAGSNIKWKFPSELAPIKLLPCSRVYSFVLEESGAASDMIIGPYEAVSLAHGITEDAVAAHDYLGTNSVREDLAQIDGWKEGRVELEPTNRTIRGPETNNLVSKLRQVHSKRPPLTSPCGHSLFAIDERRSTGIGPVLLRHVPRNATV